jgi:hypothetical protein
MVLILMLSMKKLCNQSYLMNCNNKQQQPSLLVPSKIKFSRMEIYPSLISDNRRNMYTFARFCELLSSFVGKC